MRWALAWVFYGVGEAGWRVYQWAMPISAKIQGPSSSGPWDDEVYDE